jgi:hypothetical protein
VDSFSEIFYTKKIALKLLGAIARVGALKLFKVLEGMDSCVRGKPKSALMLKG